MGISNCSCNFIVQPDMTAHQRQRYKPHYNFDKQLDLHPQPHTANNCKQGGIDHPEMSRV